MTAADIKSILSANHQPPEWVFITELRTETGGGLGGSERYFDAFAMHCWKSKGYQRIGYEIKVDRGDWLKELANPWKKAKGFFLTHKFYYVCPAGIVDFQKDLGREALNQWNWSGGTRLHGAGLITIDSQGTQHIEIHATSRTPFPMPDTFVAALLRRLNPDPTDSQTTN